LRTDIAMIETQKITLKESLKMESSEFEAMIILKHLAAHEGVKVSEEDLEIVVRWAKTTFTDAILLGMLLEGDVVIGVDNREVEFKLALTV